MAVMRLKCSEKAGSGRHRCDACLTAAAQQAEAGQREAEQGDVGGLWHAGRRKLPREHHHVDAVAVRAVPKARLAVCAGLLELRGLGA